MIMSEVEQERNYIPLEVEKLEYPLAEISKLLVQIDNLCLDVQKIEKHLSEKYNLTRKMIRQIAIEYHERDFTETLNEMQLLHQEHQLLMNPASIINIQHDKSCNNQEL
tara:strand:+ start:559 stop:885 length:327 start_codon:yes stop_codon:yes gene_type:complete